MLSRCGSAQGFRKRGEIVMKGARCPAEEQLSSFSQGLLNEALMEHLSDHIEHCSDCEQTLRNLETIADGVILQLRQPPSENRFADEAEFQQRIAVVKALGADCSISPVHESSSIGFLASLPQLREYELLSQIGQGGMGTVYKAIHQRLGKTVAIKLIAQHKVSNDAAIECFAREMKAIGQLEHPNLIRAHDAGEVDGRHFLVMEFLEGVDLSQLVRSLGPLPTAEACELIRQASLGLQYAHELGLVHRDIKPSNLMLTKDGQVKVLDLGLALFGEINRSAIGSTAIQPIEGTIEYMAPEQVGATRSVDIRADVYSLGATLYRLLTSQVPIADTCDHTVIQKLTALVTRKPTPITERRSDLPAALVTVIHKMLATDPRQRFSTPADVAHALQPFAAPADLSGLISSVRNGRTESFREGIGQLPPRQSQVRPRFRSITSMAAVGVSITCLALAVLFWLSPQGLVRIEINDSQIRAQFDRDGLTIAGVDQQPIKVGTRSDEIDSGEHRLVIQRGELKFETDIFKIDRTGETILKIQLVGDNIHISSNGRQVTSAPLPGIHPGIVSPIDVASVERTPPTLDGAWITTVQSLKPEEQIKAVIAELQRRNPRFDGQSNYKVVLGVVTEFRIVADQVSDILPVRAFPGLKELDCIGSQPRFGALTSLSALAGLSITHLNVSCNPLRDLSPLSGTPLTVLRCAHTHVSDLTPLLHTKLSILNCTDTRVTDLSPLKDLPITNLAFSQTQVSDLSPLGAMNLTSLGFEATPVSDLLPLKGMKLFDVYLTNTQVTDLSHLIGMPLRTVKLNIKSARDAEIVKTIDTLQSINDMPAAEFWKERETQKQ